LWLKLVKDFLKVRCRLALLPFLISCLIWLDLVASLPQIGRALCRVRVLLHFLSLMLGSVLVLMLPLLVWLTPDLRIVGMGDAGIKSAIQGSNVPNPDEAVPSFVSGAMAKAGKGLLEGTLQAGTSAVSDKLLDLVGLGGKSA